MERHLAMLAVLTLARSTFAGDEPSSYSVVGKVIVEVEEPKAPATPPEPRAVLREGRITTLERVYFVSGGAAVRPQSLPTLDEVAALIRGATAIRQVRIEAHTDSVASDNRTLSQRRADWVRAWLVRKGVPPEKLVAIGFGDTRPVASNDTPEGRQLNRRVEFIVAD
ncbi:MAG: OmpA family protein [Myxococcota bacterium]